MLHFTSFPTEGKFLLPKKETFKIAAKLPETANTAEILQDNVIAFIYPILKVGEFHCKNTKSYQVFLI